MENGERLPIHPHPKRNELLSSWLTRVAHRNQFKVHSFCATYFGRDKSIWNRDIDKLSPQWLLQGMSDVTGISMSELEETTLRSYEHVIYERLNPQGNTKWILPLGVYHRIHRRHGLQYCPLCLAGDDEPYFRKQWRLAFYTMCETHRILLRDSCLECDSPVIFYRGDIGYKKQFDVHSMRHCHKCGADLAAGPVKMQHWVEWQHRLIYLWLLDITWLKWSCRPLPETSYSFLIFDGLHQICKLLTHHRKLNESVLYEVERLSGAPEKPISSVRYPEEYRIQDRHRIIMAASWLLISWPERFLTICNTIGITASSSVRDMINIPYWYVWKN